MLPEERARVKIDKQLKKAGWDVVSRDEYIPDSTSAIKEALMQGNTESDYARCNPEINDVLMIKDGATTGIVTVNNIDKPFSMLSSVALIKPANSIQSWYITYAMRSSWFYNYIRSEMTGVGITRVVLKQIEMFSIPLPPLAEQKRIVAKLDELLPLCEQ